MKNLFDTIKDDSDLTTLASAINAAELNDVLSGTGPFTMFAPTNDAFAKIPAADLESIMKDKVKLTKILTYHVVDGKVMASAVATMKEVKTLAKSNIKISNEAGVKINDAKVTKADIECGNGVIHLIDTVLMPTD